MGWRELYKNKDYLCFKIKIFVTIQFNPMAKTRLVLVGALACSLLSCVNEISENNDKNGKTVIKIISSIAAPQTKVKNNDFELKDSVGLFVLIQPNLFSEERCINNVCFHYSSNSEFISEKEQYYPTGNYKCDFISYYPYQKRGIKAGKAEIEVSVNSDQTSSRSFAFSDFLVAYQKNVITSTVPVGLNYKHIFCKIKLKLKLNGNDPSSILAKSPIVHIDNLNTKSTYNFETMSLGISSFPKTIVPNGTWNISGEYLVGKEMIVIPQTISPSAGNVTVQIGEKIFQGSINTMLLSSGKTEELIITCNESTNSLTSSFSHSITPWEENTSTDTPATEITNLLDISAISFNESSIYKVYSNGVEIGELCKEYLLSDNINSEAIVYYPVSDGSVNLTKGKVMKLIDCTEDTHGGTVNWDVPTNNLNYTPGNQTETSKFYINANNQLVQTGASDYPKITLSADLLSDNRGDESITYPIIKVGTQYWLRSNFKATFYNDGTPITLKTDFSTESAGYGKPTSTYCFYNHKAITSGKITPVGWSIPSSQDWQKLITYIQNDASVLKGGTAWLESEYPVSNLSGFYAVATGYFDVTYTSRKEQVRYWMAGDTQISLAEKVICLQYSSNIITEEFHKTTNALSLRIIRK